MSTSVFLWSDVLQRFAAADRNMHTKEHTQCKYIVGNTCQVEKEPLSPVWEEGCGVLYGIAGHTFMKWCNRMEITAMYAEANSLHQLASLLPVPHFTWSLL